MPSLHIPPRRRRPLLVGAVVLTLLIGAGTWWLASDSKAGAEEVVADFYLAQRAGDCERLLEVVSERSWSADGQRSREEFLEQCDDVVDGYTPPVGEVTVEYDDDNPDVAVVGLLSSSYDSDQPGRLVREDGEWKVEPGETVLRIGPPAEEALHGYLDAYREGDCEAITSYVTEETWSESGALGRDEFLRRCESAAQARAGSDATRLPADWVAVSYHGEGEAVAHLTLGSDQTSEQVSLVKQDLRWRVEGTHENFTGEAAPGTYLRSVRFVEVQDLLVDHPTVGRRTCDRFYDLPTEGIDTVAVNVGVPITPESVDPEVAVSRELGSCHAAVTLYEFADEEAARTAAERLADARADECHGREVVVPGHPTALGVRSTYCLGATVFMTHGRQLIGAYSSRGSLAAAVQVLESQLREL